MKKKFLYLGLPIVLILIFAYMPNMFVFFEFKLAPYSGAVYAVQLEDNSFVYGKIKGSSFNWIKLRDTHYFQSLEVNGEVTKNLVPQSANILTSPNNFLLVNKSKIVSIERVGKGSKLLDIMKQNER